MKFSNTYFQRVPIRTIRPKHTTLQNNRTLEYRPHTSHSMCRPSSDRSNQRFDRMVVPHNIHNYEGRHDNDGLRNRLH